MFKEMLMTTLIVMLVLMVAPYTMMRILSARTLRDFNSQSAAAIGFALPFFFTSGRHFMLTEPMSHMLPPWVPARVSITHATGILEFAIALGFLVRRSRQFTGLVAVAFLVLFFPANIYATFNYVPMGGHTWVLFLF
jgi:uncharacterized membrane protein